ncbi:MAG: hypothetical protein AMXMBFR34_41580 [Myxococcaceae bacterium]
MRPSALAVFALLLAPGARAEDDYSVDVRASTYAQVTRQALVPGANGVVVEPRSVASLYGYAFLRVGNVDLPWAKDSLSAELSAWGALGALPNPQGNVGDGDLQSAWVQHATKRFRVKLGRQVTLPGAARYVRFDGGDFGVRVGPVDVEAYVGVVTLPRFVRPRGYYVLGSMNDALKDPSFLDAQARPGQWLLGARVSWVGTSWLKGSLGFHEQQGPDGLAYRNLSADVSGTLSGTFTAGGRLVLDLAATRPAEARVFVDVTKLEKVPISVDYAFAAPSLLLPHTSILAAFGGASWHELGAEATWRASPFLKVTGRAAGQLYEGDRPGARASLRAQWIPDLDERWTLIAEYARTSAWENGYNHLRAAARWRATEALFATVDAATYLYDQPVRGASASVIGIANVEYQALPELKLMFSGSLTSSPFAVVEGQVLGRLVFELDAPSAGGGS